jgi:hypothetical protein
MVRSYEEVWFEIKGYLKERTLRERSDCTVIGLADTNLRSIMSLESEAKNLDRCASVIPFHCILLSMTDSTLDCKLV